MLCRRQKWFIQDLNAGQIIPTNVTPCFFYVMQYIFYAFIIPALMFEIITTLNPRKVLALNKRIKEQPKSEIKKSDTVFTFFVLCYFIWMCIGLVTSQWLLFLAFVVLSILPFKKWPTGVVIDGVVTIILLLFIVINKFHLHYSMPELWHLVTK